MKDHAKLAARAVATSKAVEAELDMLKQVPGNRV